MEDYKAMMREDMAVADEADEEEIIVATAGAPDTISTKQTQEDAEYNLLEALLAAADFENDVTSVEIRRGGKYYFTVHIRPLSDEETRIARKKSTKMVKNPAGKRLPKVEGEFNDVLFNSWIIYLATTDEDKKQIWGNKAFMDKFDILDPVLTIDKILTFGEKTALADKVAEISGMDDDDDMTDEEYAKN